MRTSLLDGARGSGNFESASIWDHVPTGVDGLIHQPSRASVNFSGGLKLPPEERSKLPFVLLPLMAETSAGVARAIETTYKIQALTQSFRVVVVTDLDIFSHIRPMGWSIEHIRTEDGWTGALPWMKYVERFVANVIEQYSCVHVVRCSSVGLAQVSREVLGSLAGMPPCTKSPSTAPGESAGFSDNEQISPRLHVHNSWRGWMATVPIGQSHHQVIRRSGVWDVSLVFDPSTSMAAIRIAASSTVDDVSADSKFGKSWNSMTVRAPDDAPTAEVGLAIRALSDGFSYRGASIVLCPPSYLRGLEDRVRGCALLCSSSDEIDIARLERRLVAGWLRH